MRNKLTGMMMLAVAALGLIGCSDKLTDESGGTNGLEGSESYVYMNVAISLPTDAGTRSGTEDGPFGNTGDDQTNSDEDKNGTGNTDYEYGYANENTVNSVYLVLATVNDEYITHEQLDNNSTVSDAVTERYSFIATQKFDRAAINKAYENGGLLATNKTVHVYAFCNPTQALMTMFDNMKADETKSGDKTWLQGALSLTEINRTPDASIWESENFLMSNATPCTVTFPATIDDWSLYSRESNPFHLSANNNPVRVERTAARFDYKDGSESTVSYGSNLVGYKYAFKTNDENQKNLVSVALTRMSLVNMSKGCYYLRHVSNNGKWNQTSNGEAICGTETSKNYVVDTDWSLKSQENGITITNANTYFNYPLYKNNSNNETLEYNYNGWDNYLISTVLNGKDDTWKGSANNRYHIWRYVTENTIPDSESQKHIQSVGIVFKGRLIAGDDVNATYTEDDASTPYLSQATQDILAEASKAKSDQKKTLNEYPVLYNFNYLFYAGFEDLVACAVKEPVSSSLQIAVKNVLNHWYLEPEGTTYKYYTSAPTGEGYTVLSVAVCNEILHKDQYPTGDNVNHTIDFIGQDGKIDLTNLSPLIVEQKITTYEAEEDAEFGIGYYCYYFYWNRHNDNGQPSTMGPMEFATVRNNVYKLSVTGIRQPGHPTIPSNDPNPVKPEESDESDEIYMDVAVEVLPWVVRVNDIEF